MQPSQTCVLVPDAHWASGYTERNDRNSPSQVRSKYLVPRGSRTLPSTQLQKEFCHLQKSFDLWICPLMCCHIQKIWSLKYNIIFLIMLARIFFHHLCGSNQRLWRQTVLNQISGLFLSLRVTLGK